MENRYCPDVAKPERFENLEKLTSLEDLAIPHPSPPLAVSGGRESIFFPPYKGGIEGGNVRGLSARIQLMWWGNAVNKAHPTFVGLETLRYP
jgi:hypothetical protein